MAAEDQLKIAVVGLTHPFRGGISHYTTLLFRSLQGKHDVRFYALYRQYPSFLFPGKTQYDESSSSLSVPHEACIDSINPFTWLMTARRIVRYKPDLILFSWWHPFFAPAFGTIAHLSRLFGRIPSCFLCHNAVPHEQTIFDRLLLRYAFSAGDVFIAHSRQDYDDLKAMLAQHSSDVGSPDGSVCTVVFAQDVSDVMTASEALSASEDRFRALAENTPDIITEIDCDGRQLSLGLPTPCLVHMIMQGN